MFFKIRMYFDAGEIRETQVEGKDDLDALHRYMRRKKTAEDFMGLTPNTIKVFPVIEE